MPEQPRQDHPSLAKTDGYRKEDWDGHDLYQCNDCPFDTMDDNLMREHQKVVHNR